MIIKFMKHGQGSCAAAEAYLLGEKDAKGEVRSGVKVLKGDMRITAKLADSLEFKNKYTSLVIAWHPSDQPTDAEIEEVIFAFEELAFAGLESSQYNMTAVLHIESSDSKHVHIVIPRVELQTGNSMNIVPPKYQGFDYLSDYLNESKGWRSPDSSSPNYSGRGKGASEWGSRKELKNIIDAVEMGLIDNQEDVIAHINALSGVECINVSKGFITIKTDDMKKGMRLKDAQYRRDYDFQNFRDAKGTEVSEECRFPVASRARITELKERVTESAVRRAQYNHDRYAKLPRINVGAFGIDEQDFVEVNRGVKERHAQSLENQQERDALTMVEGGTHSDSNGGDFISDLGAHESAGCQPSHAEEYANINFRRREAMAQFRQKPDAGKRKQPQYSLSMDQIKECKDGEEKQSSIFKRASQYIIERFERASRNVRKAVEYFNEASQCLNLANRGIKQRCDRARKSAKSNDLLCEEISSIIEQTDRVNDLITELTLQEQILETKSVIESDEFKL